MNREIFREYDIRGNVERDLTDEVVRAIGRGLAEVMKNQGKTKASVARDCRLSSEHFRDLLVAGMMEGGLHVTDLGLVPTPLFYFSLFNLDVEGGAMITGSHNPPEFNGFKVAVGKHTLYGHEIQRMADIVEQGGFTPGKGSYTEYTGIVDDYYAYLRAHIRLDKKMRVALDAGNGTGGVVACPIMEKLGQEVFPLYCEMDGRFPNHFPDPTVEKNLESLQRLVAEKSAHLGIGYDGDADRIGVVDDKGNIIRGDYLMIIFARAILARNKGGTFVSEVKCSRNLFEDIGRRGGVPVMWKAGHSLIKQKMKETNALLGGEMSGHMFFADRFFGYDDAIYASLRLLEILAESGLPLSDMLSDLPRLYSTPEIRLECPSEAVKFQVVRKITEYYRSRFDVIDTDGVRVLLPDGWGLVRASNTQPILVLRFEAETEEALSRIQRMVEDDLRTMMTSQDAGE